MTRRAALLCDGSSDAALSGVARRIARTQGHALDVEVVDFSLLRPGLALDRRLKHLPELVGNIDLLLIHRDAERESAEFRKAEIESAVKSARPTAPVIPLIPVRMTEAWLLCDEDQIRRVAGNPSGRAPLHLPRPGTLERSPDPKAMLKEAIVVAAGSTGRRRTQLERRFSEIRRQLLEELDVEGPVTRLPSFNVFSKELRDWFQQPTSL